MENYEDLDLFYREHDDMTRVGQKVHTLTEAGLAEYVHMRRKEDLLPKNTVLLIDFNLDAGSKFSKNMQTEIIGEFSKTLEVDKRICYIIHRDGHTVSLIRELDEKGVERILLMDSYNAYGAKDSDHLALLELIRKCCPNTKIFTLHDKMQSDYYSCRIFAVENLIEAEIFFKKGKNLVDFIESGSETYNRLTVHKAAKYIEIEVTTIAIPMPIVPHIQSLSIIDKISDGKKLLETERKDGITYCQILKGGIEELECGKKINRLIAKKSREVNSGILKFKGCKLDSEVYDKSETCPMAKQKEQVQQTFVGKLEVLRELKRTVKIID